MIIKTRTLDDFLKNLRQEGARVFNKIVFEDVLRVPLNGKTEREATSFDVYYQASTILVIGDEAHALLDLGEYCGIDRAERGDPKEGSIKYAELSKRLREAAEGRFFVQPGKLEL